MKQLQEEIYAVLLSHMNERDLWSVNLGELLYSGEVVTIGLYGEPIEPHGYIKERCMYVELNEIFYGDWIPLETGAYNTKEEIKGISELFTKKIKKMLDNEKEY